MLVRGDLLRQPTLYVTYLLMLALRTSYAAALLPLSLLHVYRHCRPRDLPPLARLDRWHLPGQCEEGGFSTSESGERKHVTSRE